MRLTKKAAPEVIEAKIAERPAAYRRRHEDQSVAFRGR
jgi:hypothetical protein